MPFPTTDYPTAIDAAQSRVDNVDVVWDDDFNYSDEQIRRIQTLLGTTSQLIGQGIAASGPGGMVSPIASGAPNRAFTLAARNSFAAGHLLSVGDAYDTVYTDKLLLNYAGLLWTLGGVDATNKLKIPRGALPVVGEAGRLHWDTGDSLLKYDDGASWIGVGGSPLTIIDGDLPAQVTAAGGSRRTFLIFQNETLNANLTVPVNVALAFVREGRITVTSPAVLRIQSGESISAPKQQIFVADAGGVLIENAVVYPEWWGAVGDGTTNDTPPVQKAFDSLSKEIIFSDKAYRMEVNVAAGQDAFRITTPAWRCIKVANRPGLVIRAKGQGRLLIDAHDSSSNPSIVFYADACDEMEIENLSIWGLDTTEPGAEYRVAMEIQNSRGVWVHGGEIRYCGSGLRFWNCDVCWAEEVNANHCYDTGVNLNASRDCVAFHCDVQSCGDGNCTSYNSERNKLISCYFSRSGQVGVVESTREGAIIDCNYEGNLNPSWFTPISVGAGDVYLSISNERLQDQPNGTGRLYTAAGAGTTGYTATTISAAAADQSFNDSGAGLPVCAPGDVICVRGFTAPTNNGYFEVVTRTASKITTTSVAIVDEAAGSSFTVAVPPQHLVGSVSDGGVSWTFLEDDVPWLRSGPIVNRSQNVTVANNHILGACYGITIRETDIAGAGGVTTRTPICVNNHIIRTQQRMWDIPPMAMWLEYTVNAIVEGNQFIGTETGQQTPYAYDIIIRDRAGNVEGRRNEGLKIIGNQFVQTFQSSGGSDWWGQFYGDRHFAIYNEMLVELEKCTIANNDFVGVADTGATDYMVDLGVCRQLTFNDNKAYRDLTDENGPDLFFTAEVHYGTFLGNDLRSHGAGDASLNFEDDSEYVLIEVNNLINGITTAGQQAGYPIRYGARCHDFTIKGNNLRGQFCLAGDDVEPLNNSIFKDNHCEYENATAIQSCTDLPMYGAIADDGGVQTNETTAANNATTNDMTLLPAAPVAGDAYFFGCSARFERLRLQVGQNGAGTWTITWKYWNGSTYANLTTVTDGTSGFTAGTGSRYVTFTVPDDWQPSTEGGITAYFIKADLTSFTSITTQPLGTRAWVDLDMDLGVRWDGAAIVRDSNRYIAF
jgi:hypothetical protein